MPTPENVLNDIKKQYSALLLKHPEERANSIGYVYDNLNSEHCAAAIWMYENCDTEITAHNLHDLIGRWDECAIMAELPDLTFVDDQEIPQGEFNMMDLIGYFQNDQV